MPTPPSTPSAATPTTTNTPSVSRRPAATFRWLFRDSFDGGLNWNHCDTNGAGSNGDLEFTIGQVGTIIVQERPSVFTFWPCARPR